MNVCLNIGVPYKMTKFSQFMAMIPNAVPFDVDNIYFCSTDTRIAGNPYNWVFNQSCDESFLNIDCNPVWVEKAENCADYYRLKNVCSKIIIKDGIIERVNYYADLFGDKILGVHVRMGDMNICHPEFGVFSTQDYIDKIKIINPSCIYLASDNEESIRLMRKEVSCNIIVAEGLVREKRSDYGQDGIHNYLLLNNEKQWIDSWMECLLLAKCTELLCRVSNLSNTAILFSNSLTKIHRL
jgi:hypothetical protein